MLLKFLCSILKCSAVWCPAAAVTQKTLSSRSSVPIRPSYSEINVLKAEHNTVPAMWCSDQQLQSAQLELLTVVFKQQLIRTAFSQTALLFHHHNANHRQPAWRLPSRPYVYGKHGINSARYSATMSPELWDVGAALSLSGSLLFTIITSRYHG